MELPTPLEIQNFQKRIRENPIWFVNTVLKEILWTKQKEIMTALLSNNEVVVRSSNAIGKSYIAARIVHWWLLGNTNSVVVTTAPTFRQCKEILWREIKASLAGKSLYPDSAITDTKIDIDNKWFAIGLSSDKPDQFQGIHGKKLLAIIDEGSGVSDVIFEAIDGLKPDKLLVIGNPMRNTGRFAKMFKEKNIKKIHISAFDVPNVTENKVIIPGLITNEDIQKFKDRYGEDSDVYRVRVLGEFPQAESDSYISISEIEQAINREVEVLPHWEKKMGVDVALFGGDRTVFIIRQMEKVLKKTVLNCPDTMSIAGEIIKTIKEELIKAENVYIDQIGIGIGIAHRLKEQGYNVNGINVAMSADDTEHYLNQRVELASKVKDWLKTGVLLKDDDFYEIANVKYKFTSKGQLQLESKQDMKGRGLPSCDIFDALALTFAKNNNIVNYHTEQSEGVKVYYEEFYYRNDFS